MKSKITPEILTELCDWLRLPFVVQWSDEISGLVEVLYVPFKEPGYDGDPKSAKEWLKRNPGRHGITAPLRESAEYLCSQSKQGDALSVAVKALGWYAGMLRPEDRLNDNGDKATAALIVMMEKLK